MSETRGNITELLRSAASGERRDLDALMSAIYDDLRRLAVSQMQGERNDHTLQATAVVHEAYMRLVDQRNTDWKDRLHFFSIASRVIRRILIDHARERLAQKRGGGGIGGGGGLGGRVELPSEDIAAPMPSADLLALDEALAELAEIDERQARIVELRYFGGCSIDEVAELMSMGKRSVDREWSAAKAWLFCRLTEDSEPGDA